MPGLYCVGSNSATAWQTQTTRTAADWVKAFGGAFNASDPLAAQYTQIVNRDMPPALPSISRTQWKACAEACMRMRSFLYCTATVGDAPAAKIASYGNNSGSTLRTVGTFGGLGLSTAGVGTGIFAAGTAAAKAIPVIGAIFGLGMGIAGLIGNMLHTEDADRVRVLTLFAQQVPPAISQIDAAVAAGQLPAAQGIAALQSLAQQFRQTTAQYSHPGNSIEAYAAILDCIADISGAYYALATSAVTSKSNMALLGGAAIVGAKLYGVF